MTVTLRQRTRIANIGNRCMTITEALDELEKLGQKEGFDALIMCQSWPVSEFRVFEDDPEDKEAACAPKIIEVILDMRVPQERGWPQFANLPGAQPPGTQPDVHPNEGEQE